MYVGQLAREERDRGQVEFNISSLQKDIVRLNTLITEKRGAQEHLEQGTVLLENDYIHALKVCNMFVNLLSVQLRKESSKGGDYRPHSLIYFLLLCYELCSLPFSMIYEDT